MSACLRAPAEGPFPAGVPPASPLLWGFCWAADAGVLCNTGCSRAMGLRQAVSRARGWEACGVAQVGERPHRGSGGECEAQSGVWSSPRFWSGCLATLVLGKRHTAYPVRLATVNQVPAFRGSWHAGRAAATHTRTTHTWRCATGSYGSTHSHPPLPLSFGRLGCSEELPRPSDLKDDLSAKDKKLSDVT